MWNNHIHSNTVRDIYHAIDFVLFYMYKHSNQSTVHAIPWTFYNMNKTGFLINQKTINTIIVIYWITLVSLMAPSRSIVTYIKCLTKNFYLCTNSSSRNSVSIALFVQEVYEVLLAATSTVLQEKSKNI